MSIQKIRYFIAIVENNLNITKAAEEIHISQPALSKIMKSFEAEMNGSLFMKKKGRFKALTPYGNEVYKKSLKINRAYTELEALTYQINTSISGNVVIGIPSFLLSSLYSDMLPKIISDNPMINISIEEMPATIIREQLDSELIDIGILIEPIDLKKEEYKTKRLLKQEYYAYMSIHNILANKESVTWSELGKSTLALTKNSSISASLIQNKFKEENIIPNVRIQSETWDYLISVCKNSDLITILPAIRTSDFDKHQIKKVPIEETIMWQSVITVRKSSMNNKTIKYIFNLLSNVERQE